MKIPVLQAFLFVQIFFATFGNSSLPVVDFAREPAVPLLVLAPDGETAAYFEQKGRTQRLVLVDFPTGVRRFSEIDEGRYVSLRQAACFWVNNQRLMYAGGDHQFAAIDRNGKRHLALPGGPLIHLFRDEKEGWLLTEGQETLVARHAQPPYVLKINSRNGATLREVENPGNVIKWLADPRGVIAVAVERKEKSGRTRIVYRTSNTAEWSSLAGLGWDDPKAEPLGFSADGTRLFLTRGTPGDTWGVYAYDLARQELGPPVLMDPRYDIRPSEIQVFARGYPSVAVIFSPVDHTVLGIRYHTEFPQVHWFDPEFAAVQQEINAALPGKVNYIVSHSDNRQRLVVFSWGANDPGTFCLFDRQTQTGDILVARMPWFDPQQMAETQALKVRTRDGVEIDGYVTLPRERAARRLPLVVLLQAGPGQREYWEFDPMVQFLADRGYAVLQVNGRGSSGYGPAFAQAGRLDLGLKPITDVADAIRWAIDRGLADPARVAIVGANRFGGYAALMLAATEPSLVQAVAAEAPFVDWTEGEGLRKLDQTYAAFFQTWIAGDTQPDEAALRQLSPAHQIARIKTPILLIHDKSWGGFAFGRTKELAAALAKRGHPVEFIARLDGGADGTGATRQRLEAIEALLARHLNAPP